MKIEKTDLMIGDWVIKDYPMIAQLVKMTPDHFVRFMSLIPLPRN